MSVSAFAPFGKLADLHERTAPFAKLVAGTEPPDPYGDLCVAKGTARGQVDYAIYLIRQGRTKRAIEKLIEARDVLGGDSFWDDFDAKVAERATAAAFGSDAL